MRICIDLLWKREISPDYKLEAAGRGIIGKITKGRLLLHMTLAANHGPAWLSLGTYRLVAPLALKMEGILQGNRILRIFRAVA